MKPDSHLQEPWQTKPLSGCPALHNGFRRMKFLTLNASPITLRSGCCHGFSPRSTCFSNYFFSTPIPFINFLLHRSKCWFKAPQRSQKARQNTALCYLRRVPATPDSYINTFCELRVSSVLLCHTLFTLFSSNTFLGTSSWCPSCYTCVLQRCLTGRVLTCSINTFITAHLLYCLFCICPTHYPKQLRVSRRGASRNK